MFSSIILLLPPSARVFSAALGLLGFFSEPYLLKVGLYTRTLHGSVENLIFFIYLRNKQYLNGLYLWLRFVIDFLNFFYVSRVQYVAEPPPWWRLMLRLLGERFCNTVATNGSRSRMKGWKYLRHFYNILIISVTNVANCFPIMLYQLYGY